MLALPNNRWMVVGTLRASMYFLMLSFPILCQSVSVQPGSPRGEKVGESSQHTVYHGHHVTVLKGKPLLFEATETRGLVVTAAWPSLL